MPDAVLPDASLPDAVLPDPAQPDAGQPDAGQPDGERCNGLDDDADETIDEGFDLTRDPNNCGVCGHACGGLGMREACRAGQCLPVGCEPGFFDENLDASDGCEAVGGGRSVFYVRAGEPGGDGNGVGTRDRPFATIAAALRTGGGDDEIVLLPGTFVEAVRIEVARVWLRADVPGTVFIESPDTRPAIEAGGFWSRIQGVTVRAPHATSALVLAGAAIEVDDVAIEDVNTSPGAGGDGPVAALWIREPAVRVSDVRIAAVAGEPRAGQTNASGVQIDEDAGDVMLVGLDVRDIRAADAPAQGFRATGGSAFGVRAEGAPRLTIVDTRIRDVSGGTGSGDAILSLGQGGNGGRAVGLFLASTDAVAADGLRVDTLSIEGLRGGPGGLSTLTPAGDQTNGADGGAATGLALVRVDDAQVTRLEMSAPTLGGAGSPVSPDGLISFDGGHGGRGTAAGVALVDSQRFGCIASRIDGLTVSGGSEGVPPGARFGFVIDAASRGAVVDTSVRVHGDPVLYLDGGAGVRIEGHALRSTVPGTNWGHIAVRAGTDVTVTGNTLTNAVDPDPWFGREVVGIFIGAEATNVHVEDNTLGPLVAGEVYVPVTGVRIEASPGDTLFVQGNRFLDICGACMRTASDNPLLGVDTRRNLVATNNLFARMHGQETTAYRLQGPVDNAIISRETFVDLTAQQTATGVFVAADVPAAQVNVRNSIFAGVQTPLRRENPQAEDEVSLDHVLLWQVETPVVGGTLGAHVIEQDPLLDPQNDARPLPGSPAIDAGDPRSDCSQEPPGDPDGECRLDLGHTGNTGAAQSVGGR